MMPFDEAAKVLEQRFDAQWTATEKTWQTARYDPQAGTEFVYFEVLQADGIQASFGDPGSNVFRDIGLIQAHVFVPVGTGDGKALQYARQIGEIFKGQNISGILCRAPRIGGGDTGDDDGNFWRRTVSIPFRSDDLA